MTNERKIFLKQQCLKREVEMSIRNTKNFRHKWREMMMKVQMPEMKQDVIIKKNIFERTLDNKNYCAQFTMKCLENFKVQRHRNIIKHMEAIEKFTSIYHSRLDSANLFYQNNFNDLIIDFMIDMEKMEHTQSDDRNMFRAMIYKSEQQIKSIIDNTNAEIVSKLENLREDCDNLTKIAVLQLEENLSTKWKNLNKIISNYLDGTRRQRLVYEDLEAKDVSDREVISHQLMRTAELYKSIHEHKNKILKLNEDTDETVVKIASGKFRFREANQSLIKQFHDEQKIDKIQLNTLTTHYNLAIRDLQCLVKQARAILFLIRKCRKFQIQSEKILPIRDGHINGESNRLDVFWYRVGLAQVLTNDLKRDRETLEKERDRLHKCLKCRIINT
ncbi:hypothetical protein PV328_010260 [Microctonus aethiopoides]|uniref:Coiled-coil domain-containing protein 65 n=1 Tax=Microctonus aethiopoides TaxID=144406 RepID=A0AA39F035_9HYME|nr:hypothetical protein PV328_010260 [Microctonus aethiopoides]